MIEKLKNERERIGTWGNLNPSRLEVIFKFAGNKLLDVGCSKGDYVRFLIEKGYDAYGLDILYHEEWKDLKDRFKQGDVQNLPFENEEFDTLLLFEVLEHIENPQIALKEVRRVTRKNIIISVPDCELYPYMEKSALTFYHWVDRTHIYFFTSESLKSILKENGFETVFLTKINPVYPEILLFLNFNISIKFSEFLSRIIRKLKFRNIFMTLLCVAEKK